MGDSQGGGTCLCADHLEFCVENFDNHQATEELEQQIVFVEAKGSVFRDRIIVELDNDGDKVDHNDDKTANRQMTHVVPLMDSHAKLHGDEHRVIEVSIGGILRFYFRTPNEHKAIQWLAAMSMGGCQVLDECVDEISQRISVSDSQQEQEYKSEVQNAIEDLLGLMSRQRQASVHGSEHLWKGFGKKSGKSGVRSKRFFELIQIDETILQYRYSEQALPLGAIGLGSATVKAKDSDTGLKLKFSGLADHHRKKIKIWVKRKYDSLSLLLCLHHLRLISNQSQPEILSLIEAWCPTTEGSRDEKRFIQCPVPIKTGSLEIRESRGRGQASWLLAYITVYPGVICVWAGMHELLPKRRMQLSTDSFIDANIDGVTVSEQGVSLSCRIQQNHAGEWMLAFHEAKRLAEEQAIPAQRAHEVATGIA